MVGHDPVFAARNVSGEIRFSPQSSVSAELRLAISTGSLSVQNDINDKDRREIERTMRDEVLEVSKYPDVTFASSSGKVETVGDGRYRVEVDGDLSLHGVKHRQRLSAQVFTMGETLRAQGEFQIRQTDYGIKLVSAAGGTLKIKDDVKISFDLLARKGT